MLDQVKTTNPVIANGINVTEYEEIVQAVREDHGLAKFGFRVTNAWKDATSNLTTIAGFYGAGEEHGADGRRFTVAADDPRILLGTDRAPTPVKFLLHALASCLTSTIVYKAAVKGIRVDSIESHLEGDLNALQFMELSEKDRLGYQGIRATFGVAADASADEILKLTEFSPVLDVIRNGTPVTLKVEKA